MGLKDNKTEKKHLILDEVVRYRYDYSFGNRTKVAYNVKTWRCPHCNGEVFKGVHNRKKWDK
jgi:hypothetical protein